MNEDTQREPEGPNDLDGPRTEASRDDRRSEAVEVVVCVHDALEHTQRALASVDASRLRPARTIVVDDGSSPGTRSWLAEWAAGAGGRRLLANEARCGYTRSANLGLGAATTPWVLLLNSDAILPRDALGALLDVANATARVAAVGPVSDAAGYQSVPRRFDEHGDFAVNELPPGMSLDEYAALVAGAVGSSATRVPLLNGFCLLLRRAAVEEVGLLDEVSFPDGYGEENDLCLRLRRAGHGLVVATGVWVHHAKSRSYTDERRRALGRRGDIALRRRHGSAAVDAATRVTAANADLARARELVREARRESGPADATATSSSAATNDAGAGWMRALDDRLARWPRLRHTILVTACRLGRPWLRGTSAWRRYERESRWRERVREARRDARRSATDRRPHGGERPGVLIFSTADSPLAADLDARLRDRGHHVDRWMDAPPFTERATLEPLRAFLATLGDDECITVATDDDAARLAAIVPGAIGHVGPGPRSLADDLARRVDDLARETERESATDASVRASIVIVTHGALDATKRCVESIERSGGPRREIIVVDNASPDGTSAWLEELEREGRARIILNRENRGFAAANNQGLAAARGDVLVLLNSDTVVTRGWLRTLVDHLERDPDLGLVGPVTNRIENEARIPTFYRSLDTMPAEAFRRTRLAAGRRFDIPVLAFYCVAMRRETFETVGPLDEGYGLGYFEDDDYARRVRRAGLDVVCVEDVFVHHEHGASFRALRPEDRRALFERNRAYFESKWGPWGGHECG